MWLFDFELVEMTGEAIVYTVPANMCSVAFTASVGDITMYNADATHCWVLKEGEKECVDGRAISGCQVTLIGTAGNVVRIRLIPGMLS